MKWAGYLVATALVLALIGLVGYGIYTYLFPVWAAILYFGYLIFGLVFSVSGAVLIFRDLRSVKPVRDEIAQAVSGVVVARAQNWLTNFRNWVGAIAGLFSSAIVWPVDVFRGAYGNLKSGYGDVRMFLIRYSLHPVDQFHAIFAVVSVVVVYAFGIIVITGDGFGRVFIFTIAVSVFFRHIRYVVEIESLPVRLRRASGISYITFITIVTCDLVTLILASTLLITNLSPSDIQQEHLATAVAGLFRFRELIRLFSGVQLSPAEFIITITGLVFYLALIRVLLRFKEFRKTDEDYIWLATQNDRLGRFRIAMSQLRNVKNRTSQAEIATVVALLGLNQIQQAEDRVALVLQQNDQPHDADNIFAGLIDACVFTPIPEHILIAIFQRGIEQQVSDVRLQDAISIFAGDSETIGNALTDIISETDNHYPLSRIALYIATGRFSEAQEVLNRTTPENSLEKIAHLVMFLRAELENPEITADEEDRIFMRWAETKLPTIVALLPELSTAWEKAFAFVFLAYPRFVATAIASDREQEISYLCDNLQRDVKGDSVAETIVQASELRIARLTKEIR